MDCWEYLSHWWESFLESYMHMCTHYPRKNYECILCIPDVIQEKVWKKMKKWEKHRETWVELTEYECYNCKSFLYSYYMMPSNFYQSLSTGVIVFRKLLTKRIEFSIVRKHDCTWTRTTDLGQYAWSFLLVLMKRYLMVPSNCVPVGFSDNFVWRKLFKKSLSDRGQNRDFLRKNGDPRPVCVIGWELEARIHTRLSLYHLDMVSSVEISAPFV